MARMPGSKSVPSKWRTVSLVLLSAMIGGAMIGPVSAAVSFSREDRKFIRKTARKIANKRQKNLRNDLQPQIDANAAAIGGLAGASGVLSSFKDGPGDLTGTIDPIATLSLPAGNYALFSKVTVHDGVSSFGVDTFCELRIGASVVDSGWGNAEFSGDLTSQAQLTINLMAPVGTSGATATLACGNDPNDEFEQAKLMAIKAPSISNVASSAPVKAPTGR